MLSLLAACHGLMYDHLQPLRSAPSSCEHGCALWSDLASDGNTRSQSDVDAKWAKGTAPSDANRACAAPGNDPGTYGSWCYCRQSGDSSWGYCEPTLGQPEQINLQLSSGDSVVVSFVTFEAEAPTDKPTVTIDGKTFTGATHVHSTPAKDRTLYLHFVPVRGLTPRKKYSYTVASGGARISSPSLTFRAPYADGVTRLAMFGDMGVYKWNNMGNLKSDCEGGLIDAVVHIGDHAYNEGDDDERRGDGYMNMYEGILSQCPWMPVVGNHEYYSSEYLSRYMDSTWQNYAGNNSEALPKGASAVATSALGAFLSRGAFHGAGLHGPLPSGTSRWFSADLGLVHLIGLDLNLYFGTDSASESLRQQQAAWLKEDLAAANANRKATPWIIASSHYPFYCSECASQAMTADWYANGFVFDSTGVELEHPPMSARDVARIEASQAQCASSNGLLCDAKWSMTLGASTDAAIRDLMPIIHEGGVDLYMSGHWHYYESLWPMGPTPPPHGTGGPPSQKSFEHPDSTVHILTGNGGPPSKDTMNSPMAALRNKSDKYGYGRLTAFNATHLLFEQVLNGYSDEGEPGEVLDSYMVVQPHHGPFRSAVEA